MRKIGFWFILSPHGSSSGREGLDALLAASSLSNNIGVFFSGDGVLHLIPNQNPSKILARDYISTFGLLPICDIDQYFVCEVSLKERGLENGPKLMLNPERLSPLNIRSRLEEYDVILTF